VISGSYFGFHPSGEVADIGNPSAIFIDVAGIDAVIGVDYATSSLPGAKNQRNVFASNAVNVRIESFANNTIVSGNYFGYTTTGAPSTSASSVYGYGVYDWGSPVVTIGTNEDGVGDDVEQNWFGCVYRPVHLDASTARISGNYFGFGAPIKHLLPSHFLLIALFIDTSMSLEMSF